MKNNKGIKDILPLFSMQEGILYHYSLDKNIYITQSLFVINGIDSIRPIEQAMEILHKKYDILRTAFIFENLKRPVQIIHERIKPILCYEDLTKISEEDQKKFITQFIEKDLEIGFNLNKAPLLRTAIYQLGQNSFKLLITFHHIILDGWSFGILIDEFKKICCKIADNLFIDNEYLVETVSYKKFVNWIEKQDTSSANLYWKQYLSGFNSQSTWPRLKEKGEQINFRNVEMEFTLEETFTNNIKLLANNKFKTTLNIFFQSVWGVLLARYNNVHDVVYGVVKTVRPTDVKDADKIVGLCINTVPLRIKINPNYTIIDIIKDIQKESQNSEEYEYYSLAEIQANSELGKDLIESLFVFENYPIVEQPDVNNITLTKVETYERTNYNFNLSINPGKRINMVFEFNSHLYDQKLVENIKNNFINVISQLLNYPDKKIEDITLLSEWENELLVEEKLKEGEEVKRYSFIESFEKQVNQTPHYIAVEQGQKELTYSELNKKSNKLAYLLVQTGITSETPVIILCERSIEFLVGMIGVFKAGGAYIPVDINHPLDRIRNSLEDLKPFTILSSTKAFNTVFNIDDLMFRERKVIYIDEVCEKDYPCDNLNTFCSYENLAYIIHTSGSTGKPKGVMIDHRGMFNHLEELGEYLNISENSIIAQTASPSFDISVWQFLNSLIKGGKTSIISDDCILKIEDFFIQIKMSNVSILQIVPSYLSKLLDHMEELECQERELESLKFVLITGETVHPTLVQRWYKLFPEIPMINAYGPAEASDDVTLFTIPKDFVGDRVPIGKPIRNTNVYILDEFMRNCPIGVKGEMFISGIGVGRGYFNDPIKTEMHFLKDPFIGDENFTMYKTGDIGRYLLDGNIEFLGRIDNQVKIGGIRIELGEIESELINSTEIEQAIVKFFEYETGEKTLCAYYSADSELDILEIRKKLRNRLPHYMQPNKYVKLKEFPLSSNGKINRSALMRPEIITDYSDVILLENSLQQIVHNIWKEVLSKEENIDPYMDFFQVGGHSLKVTQVISRIKKELEIELSIRDFFNNPTIHELCNVIQTRNRRIWDPIELVPYKKEYDVSQLQERIWTHSKLEESGIMYNTFDSYKFEGPLSLKTFENALIELIKRQESLRTTFLFVDGKLKQKIHSESNISLSFKMYDSKKEQDLEAIIKNNTLEVFNISESLYRFILLENGENEYIFLTFMHHLISDESSSNILIDELFKLYHSLLSNEDFPVPVKVQYKDYSNWYNKKISKFELSYLKYWENTFENSEFLNLSIQKTRPPIKTYSAEMKQIEISSELITNLESIAKNNKTTLFVVFLSIIKLLLNQYTKQKSIVIGTNISRRDREELGRIIGLFVSTIPIKLETEIGDSYQQFLEVTKRAFLEAIEHPDIPNEVLINENYFKRDISRSLLFDVFFSFNNETEKKFIDKDFNITKLDLFRNNMVSHYDLTFDITQYENKAIAKIYYNIDLYEEKSIELMGMRLLNILEIIIKDNDIVVDDIQTLSSFVNNDNHNQDFEFEF